MTPDELRPQLRERYSPEGARALLKILFGDKPVYFSSPVELAEDEETVRLARQIGLVNLADNRNLALFDVEVVDTVLIAQNRKGLRDVAAKYIDQNIIHGALVFFHSPGQDDYRLTFVARFATFNLETGELEKQETQPKRYSFLLGPKENAMTAARQLMTLVEKRAASLADVTDAFSVEKLNREFFKTYKAFYDRFWRYLAEHYRPVFLGNTPVPDNAKEKEKQEKPMRDFAQKLLGRIVFLHFLQKKGWMGCPADSKDWTGGDKQFMQTLFIQFADPARFYSRCLTHLFFETLNRERPGGRFEVDGLAACRVPYLNGGLFDSDLPETLAIDFPIEYFKNLLKFFEQYNFTIDENRPDDHEVGIDPEMLGRIFENLLEENREKGVFYTPKEIVQYMCQESLIQYLNYHLTASLTEPHQTAAQKAIIKFIRHGQRGNDRDKNNFIYQKAGRIQKLLDSVRICDPATGSGAFTIGMLQEIYAAKLSINWTLNQPQEEVKKRIIQNSIYGVDIDNGAVEIARLRFWLALVVDEEEPMPLPNLDYKVIQGNSLLQRFGPVDLLFKRARFEVKIVKEVDLFGNIVNPQVSIEEFLQTKQDAKEFNITELEEKFFGLSNYIEKQRIRDKIESFEREFINQQLSQQERDVSIRLSNKEKNAVNKRDLKEVEKLRATVSELRALRQRIQKIKKNEKPYFLWHLYFLNIFEEGGFDIVIGNPPYIQLTRLRQEAVLYQEEKYDTFEKTGDIYCLFYERGIDLLKPGGVLAYITSNSWLQTQYGESLRTLLVNESDPLILLNFEDTRLFETAVVEANILITRKTVCQYHLEAATIGADYDRETDLATYVAQHSFTLTNLPSEGWAVGNAEAVRLKKQMEVVGKKLFEWPITINFGIKTSFNEAFIIEEEERDRLIAADPKNVEIIKPTLKGRDLRRYNYTFNKQWLIVAHNGVREEKIARVDVEKDYPCIYTYLNQEKFYPKIQLRADQGDHWTNLRNCAYLLDFEKPKIIWGELSDEAKFAYDEEGHYVEATIFMMTGSFLKYLLAILNSKAAGWYFDQITTTSGMGTTRWKKYKIQQLPVPEPDSDTEQQVEQLVNKILDFKRGSPDVNTIALEAQVDALIFNLYGLSEQEMLYILDQDERLNSRERDMIQNNFRNLQRGHFTLLV